jgi:hypothetical protein
LITIMFAYCIQIEWMGQEVHLCQLVAAVSR